MDKYAAAFPEMDSFRWTMDEMYRPDEYTSAAGDLRIVH